MMINGIPYFGENTNEIIDSMLNYNKKVKVTKYNSMYELVSNNIKNRIVVIINNKYITWLNDIVFNYRDKECYIPYYSYKLFKIEDVDTDYNNKGHLINIDKNIYIRYEYKYEKYEIEVSKIRLEVFNIDTMKKEIFITDKWINEQAFDIDKLYNLYVNSCFKDDSIIYDKHLGGYHFISKEVRGFKNKEKEYRKKNVLEDYDNENIIDKRYRDIRNFSFNEVVSMHGLVENNDTYRDRKLAFECYLYCIMRSELKSTNEDFNNELEKLKAYKNIIKYGDNIKLIFKRYWLNGIENKNLKTWSNIR